MIKLIFQSLIVKLFLIFFNSGVLISLTQEANDSYGIIPGGKGIIVIIIFISSIAYAVVMAVEDAHVIITNHTSRFILRGLLLSFFPVILYVQQDKTSFLYLAILAYTVFFYVFNITYNAERRFPPNYIGNTSYIDKILRKINDITFLHKFPNWLLNFQLLLILLSLHLVGVFYLRIYE